MTRKIRDTSATLRRVDPTAVSTALGAEATGERLADVFGPITLAAVRDEVIGRLQSTGGRPGLSGTTRRAKIPLSDQEWEQLEQIARSMAAPGFAPSAGQVASVLLSLSLQSLATQLGEQQPSPGSPLIRELASLAGSGAGPTKRQR